jgi:hypothetical protein
MFSSDFCLKYSSGIHGVSGATGENSKSTPLPTSLKNNNFAEYLNSSRPLFDRYSDIPGGEGGSGDGFSNVLPNYEGCQYRASESSSGGI